MESSSAFPASESITPSSRTFPEFSSCLQAPPSTQPLQQAMDFFDLSLPPNTIRILSQGQASRGLPTRFDGPAGQPVGTASIGFSQGIPVFQPTSQSPMGAQSRKPPMKARTRRTAQAAKPIARGTMPLVSQQHVTPPLSWGGVDQNTSSTVKPSNAVQAAALQVKAAPSATHVGFTVGMTPSATSSGEGAHGESKSTEPFVWATATAAEIKDKCGMDGLPLNLVEQVLPRLRAYLHKHGCRTGTNAPQTSTAQDPVPSISNSVPLPPQPTPAAQAIPEFLQSALPESIALMGIPDVAGIDPTLVPLPGFSDEELVGSLPWTPEQGLGPSTAAGPTAGPASNSFAPSAMPKSLTVEELLWQVENTVLELTAEGQSAALDLPQDLEYGQAVEAIQVENPLALPTREELDRSSSSASLNPGSSAELGQGTGIEGNGLNGFAQFNFGHLLDDWEGWNEMGFRDEL